MLRFAPAAALVVAFAAVACNGDEEGKPQTRVTVVTTLTVFEDIVREIGGDRVDVSSLLPAGADPHTYEPTPRDVQRVAEADVIFVNGLGLESAALQVLEPNLPADAPLLALAEEASRAGAVLREYEDGIDPHVWLSVDNAREYASTINDALADADPEGADAYQENYENYRARLDELASYVRDTVSLVPEERRKLVTTHGAFGYLADYIGFQVSGVVSEGPGQEPSAADIADLQETIEEAGVTAVFEEPQLGAEASVLQQAARDVGVEVCTLYSDALSDDAPTYIDLMRFNADELVRCLGE